jgi:hypothetical protein
MENKSKYQQKRCVYCGRYFVPDRRVAERQKSCKKPECRRKRKKESQRRWVEANPGYFEGRYEYVKQWRQKNPDYQKRWRSGRRHEIQDKIPPSKPLVTLRFVVPVKWFKGEIKDEIRFVRQCGCGFFVSGDRMRDTKPDSHPSPP